MVAGTKDEVHALEVCEHTHTHTYTHTHTHTCTQTHQVTMCPWYAKLFQLCPTLCDPMDYTPPGSSVYGILQARILEWVAISFFRGASQPRDRTRMSYISCIGRQGSLPPAPPAKLCVPLGRLLYISVPQFARLSKGDSGATHPPENGEDQDDSCSMPPQGRQLQVLCKQQPDPHHLPHVLLSLPPLQTGSQLSRMDSRLGYEDPARPRCKTGRRKVAKAACQQHLNKTD